MLNDDNNNIAGFPYSISHTTVFVMFIINDCRSSPFFQNAAIIISRLIRVPKYQDDDKSEVFILSYQGFIT